MCACFACDGLPPQSALNEYRSPQPAARSPQPAARSPQPAARSPQPAELIKSPLLCSGFGVALLISYQGGYWSQFDTIGALHAGSVISVFVGPALIIAVGLGAMAWAAWVLYLVLKSKPTVPAPVNQTKKWINTGAHYGFVVLLGSILVVFGIGFYGLLGGLIVATLTPLVFLVWDADSPLSCLRFLCAGGLLLLESFFLGHQVAAAVKNPNDQSSLIVNSYLKPPYVEVTGVEGGPIKATYLGRFGDNEYFYQDDGQTVRYPTTAIARMKSASR